MNRKHLVLLSLFALTTACSDAQFEDTDHDIQLTPHPMVHGKKNYVAQYKSVVAILLKDHPSYANQVICTGTLISPKHVLTAAHCVAELSSSYYLFSENASNAKCEWEGGNISTGASSLVNYLKVGFGLTQSAAMPNSYKISRLFYHSGYSSLAKATACTVNNYDGYSVKQNDIAILELAEAIPEDVASPMPILPPWLGITNQHLADHSLDTYTIFGYGYDENGDRGIRLSVELPIESYCARSGESICPYGKTVHVKGCHPDEYSCLKTGKLDYYDDHLGIPAGALFYLQANGGPCNGDSGGPLIYIIKDQPYLAGITSYGDNACSSYGISTAVQDFYDWIIKNAPEAAQQIVEVCGNGLDDDNNGFTDADDEYCKTHSYCGDNKLDSGKEQCDGDLFLNDLTNCSDWSYAYESGKVTCSDHCSIDFSQCVEFKKPDLCGNGSLDEQEQCDGDSYVDGYGEVLTSNLCSEYSGYFNGGSLKCNNNCTVDTSECSTDIQDIPYCGDGVIQKGELCDGDQMANGSSTSCSDWDSRYISGSVTCKYCKPVFSECVKESICGDGKLSGEELCDGSLFYADETECSGWSSFMQSGKVKCNANCTLDYANCKMKSDAAELCGNGRLDDTTYGNTDFKYGEECDGELFAKGDDCKNWDERFESGKVSCSDNCTVNLEKCVMSKHALYLSEDDRSSMFLLNSHAKPDIQAPEKPSDTVVITIGGDLNENLPGIPHVTDPSTPDPVSPENPTPSEDQPADTNKSNKSSDGCSVSLKTDTSRLPLLALLFFALLLLVRRKNNHY